MLSRRAISAAFFWLLAQPPLLSGGALGTDVPIARWTAKGRFDTREACEQKLGSDRTRILAATAQAQDRGSKLARDLITAARCVDSSTLVVPPPSL
jgi:hypothetical protein